MAFEKWFWQMASVLKSMRFEINNDGVAKAALSGLPERFNCIFTALDALCEKCLSADLGKNRRLQKEQRNLLRKSSSFTYSVILQNECWYQQHPDEISVEIL